ncbi:TIGR02391 family protein [Caulobacter sp. RHG1]|uniref:TIGR02391 family protein n=1 Tax=Caulobacter sp. (strain RHG1) TaxID=2545762 RepID=UPI00155592A6|nr:TIGR02391 family protein [Caulobacter sp. RHG1]NQE61517.1 hypothetical protein [Caulobacter sp. RHG1]
MATVPKLIPEIDALLGLAPEEVAQAVLTSANALTQNGLFSALSVIGAETIYGRGYSGEVGYPRAREAEINEALGTAWLWLEINMLIMPAPGANGQNGHRQLTRRGRELLAAPEAFQSFRQAAAFPKALLHPAIADAVWLDLARGDFQVAVFRAFRAVEEAVREAGGFAPQAVGVDLMRQAFNAKNGPLAKSTDPAAEQDALANLFAGAIGSYKNPHSHRTVEHLDARDAQEMVSLASHLLRIVDSRRPARA